MKLKDKVVIVTGAARGLGQEFALRAAAEGALVAAADRIHCADTAAKIEAAGGQCLPVQLDVTKAESVDEMVAEVMEKYGRIDGLVNNAAMYATIKMAPFDEISETDWDAVFTTNAKGVWLCCKAVYPHMKKRSFGSIVNISSSSILEGTPYFAHYVASKGAVWAFTRSISRTAGEYGIRVNSVTPGYTLTEAAKGIGSGTDAFEENFNANIEARAIQRSMQPGDVAGTVLFLLSDDSAFLTGQNINVDGGRTHY